METGYKYCPKRHHGFQSGLLYSFNFFKVKAVCGSGNADDIQFIHIPRDGSGYGCLTQGLVYGSGIKFPSNVSRSGLYKVNTYNTGAKQIRHFTLVEMKQCFQSRLQLNFNFFKINVVREFGNIYESSSIFTFRGGSGFLRGGSGHVRLTSECGYGSGIKFFRRCNSASGMVLTFNIFSSGRGSGYGSGIKFFRRNHSASGMVLTFNIFSSGNGSGYGSSIKFPRRHNFKPGMVLNFNSLSPRRRSGNG